MLDRLNSELLDPLISLVFDRMVQADLIPPVPDEMNGKELNVDFISILAQSQKAITTNGVDRFISNLGVVAQMKPEALDKFDADYWVDAYADSLGIDPGETGCGDPGAASRAAAGSATACCRTAACEHSERPQGSGWPRGDPVRDA